MVATCFLLGIVRTFQGFIYDIYFSNSLYIHGTKHNIRNIRTSDHKSKVRFKSNEVVEVSNINSHFNNNNKRKKKTGKKCFMLITRLKGSNIAMIHFKHA